MAIFLNVLPTIFSLSFLLLLFNANEVYSTESLSFYFPKFAPDQKDLILQGDAIVTSQGKLQLTKTILGLPVLNSMGRALYTEPIRIWDNTTGQVASFVTSFSFVINPSLFPFFTADGLAFFLAAPDTTPRSKWGYLGLFSNENYNKSNQVVAVEFDTYANPWDPKAYNQHMGIDINSIKSTQVASWGLVNGEVGTALITYQASTKTLVASVVYPSRGTSYIVSANKVDLKANLPEWVRVGFSATTGPIYTETHDIHSWSFSSGYGDVYSVSDALKDIPHLESYVPNADM